MPFSRRALNTTTGVLGKEARMSKEADMMAGHGIGGKGRRGPEAGKASVLWKLEEPRKKTPFWRLQKQPALPRP